MYNIGNGTVESFLNTELHGLFTTKGSGRAREVGEGQGNAQKEMEEKEERQEGGGKQCWQPRDRKEEGGLGWAGLGGA